MTSKRPNEKIIKISTPAHTAIKKYAEDGYPRLTIKDAADHAIMYYIEHDLAGKNKARLDMVAEDNKKGGGYMTKPPPDKSAASQ